MAANPEPVDLGIPGLGPASVVGSGGFGTVYRAEQPAFRRTVAVKVLHAHLDERGRRRFERECQTMGALSDHPGIVTILDAGVTPAQAPYLLMTYHAGGSLADRLERSGAVPWAEAVRLGIEVAEALAAAHRNEILHRDVKPANVLLSGYGNAQLTDFGIARIAGATQTRADQVTASVLYAPPEVLEGRPATPAADLYSLGATLHEILAGRPPFEAGPDDTLPAVIGRILTTPPPPLEDHGVPADLATAVAATLAKDPDHRPASTAELARHLAAVARAHDIDTGARGTPQAGAPEEAAERTIDQVVTGQVPPAHGRTPPPRPFAPTHRAPAQGLPAWLTPDPTHPVVARLDPHLAVELVGWWGDWAHVRCSNGWEAWVNGRLLAAG